MERRLYSLISVGFAASSVGFYREFVQEVEEPLGLTNKQPIVLEERHSGLCATLFGGDWPNDRTHWQVRSNELAGRREDLIGIVGPGIVRAVGRIGQVRREWQLRKYCVPMVIRQHRGIACLVGPGLIMLNLRSANGSYNPDDLGADYLGKERLVKAGATLLDAGEMKTSNVGDKLDHESVGRIRRQGQIRIGNAGYVYQIQDLRKGRSEIGIERAAITKIEAGIDGEVHQVRQPFGRLI